MVWSGHPPLDIWLGGNGYEQKKHYLTNVHIFIDFYFFVIILLRAVDEVEGE